MKAFKVFNPDWTCRNFQFEVGKTYAHEGEIGLCKAGFHACKRVTDCFNHYSFDTNNKVAEVELIGKVLGKDEDKQVTDKIKIVRELSWTEVLELANSGIGNSGYSNSGNENSGNRNSGYRNSGDWNSGDWNSGDENSGNRNSGNRNSEDWNSGDWNSGNRNSGNWNSGYGNSGNRNSGDWNSGDWNSGDWSSGDWNSGHFNSITPEDILVFNKPCKRKEWGNVEKPSFIYNVNLTRWIKWVDMTEDEKKEHKDAHITQGYLKTYSYKEAWKNAYNKASDKDIELLKALPNFDANVFEEITGIRVK